MAAVRVASAGNQVKQESVKIGDDANCDWTHCLQLAECLRLFDLARFMRQAGIS